MDMLNANQKETIEKIGRLKKQKNAVIPAHLATVQQLRFLKRRFPPEAVVSYINSSAEIKAESDVCCTSANAIEAVNSLPHEQILFVPDRDLGSRLAEHTKKEIILWDSYCYVHAKITLEKVRYALEQNQYQVTVQNEIQRKARKALRLLT